MKNLLFLTFLGFTINSFSQTSDKTVTLFVSGQGKTQNEARQNALRSAIEQAFGTFISSKTEILNDNLVKDEIVSVANGNIKKYEIITEIQIPNGDFVSSLNAIVSVDKLTNFIESKGIEAEFKGSLFSFNINQLKLNEANETKAIFEITSTSLKILSKSLVGKIIPTEPYLKNNDIYTLPYEIEIFGNENINSAVKYFSDNLNNLSLSKNEINDYLKLNKPVYEIILISPSLLIDGSFEYKNKSNNLCPVAVPSYNPSSCEFKSIYLRNVHSFDLLWNFINKVYNQINDFKIITNDNLVLDIDERKMMECKGQYKQIEANGLLPFASPQLIYGDVFPIVFSNSDYLCGGSSLGNPNFPTINKSLAKYLCDRGSFNVNTYSYFVILTHQYQKDGLVYRLKGSSNIPLTELSKISNIKIDYVK